MKTRGQGCRACRRMCPPECIGGGGSEKSLLAIGVVVMLQELAVLQIENQLRFEESLTQDALYRLFQEFQRPVSVS